jgi:hypothetical protein
LLEASGQLHIAADGLAGVIDPETDEGDLKAVAEKAQSVEDNALLAAGSGENVRRPPAFAAKP